MVLRIPAIHDVRPDLTLFKSSARIHVLIMVTCNQSEKSDVMIDKSKYFYEFVKLRVVNVMRIPNLVMHIFILPNPFVVCS